MFLSTFRSLPPRFIFPAVFFSFCLFLYVSTGHSDRSYLIFRSKEPTCSPRAYADGKWIFSPNTNDARMTSREDALKFAGFQGCGSSRDLYLHLAADKEEQWDRFPGAQSFGWQPGPECKGLKRFDAEEVVRYLVEDGGWFLVGDSVTENHFFSLSCLLYPHVLGFSNYTGDPHVDRASIQHLRLNPESPIVSRLKPPRGFDIEQTPLVSFRRVDLLLSQQEVVDIYHSTNPDSPKDFKLFGDEAVYTLPSSVYLEQFTTPLPEANYHTMVISTAGHWQTTLFHGFRNESKKDEGYGIKNVLKLFEDAMPRWADKVQTTLGRHERAGEGKRRVVIRPYLPGHEDCHHHRQPWTEIQPFVRNRYNWGNIREFNQIFERVVSSKALYPDIHFLPIDRPARLRPDAHTAGDCLHIMTGAGVLEGWSKYIWHFVTQEVL